MTDDEVVRELDNIDCECARLIDEVRAYDFNAYDPYIVGLSSPYPEADISRFCTHAMESQHLRIRFLALLERIGVLSEVWAREAHRIEFTERYPQFNDPRMARVDRPCLTGLEAARGILRAASQKLRLSKTMGTGTKARSIGSTAAVEAVKVYTERKGVSLVQFGRQCGTSDRALRNFYKTGKLRRSNFEEIAKFLGVTPQQLLNGDIPDGSSNLP